MTAIPEFGHLDEDSECSDAADSWDAGEDVEASLEVRIVVALPVRYQWV
jgi:hypothetical protein